MSTRSGKRIHSCPFENSESLDSEVTNTEKKTRNKRLKENDIQPDVQTQKLKKKKHYVNYPTDDEGGYMTANDCVDGSKSTRKLKKKETLKEHNTNVLDIENIDTTTIEETKVARVTRQTRKFVGTAEDASQNVVATTTADSLPNGKVMVKKNKKKKSKSSDFHENIIVPNQELGEPKAASKKSKKKKKKGKHVSTSTEEPKQALNKSNISTDSFHSAAGSPVPVVDNLKVIKSPELEKIDATKIKDDIDILNNTFEKESKKKKVSYLTILPADNSVVEPEIINNSKKERKISLKPDSPVISPVIKQDSNKKKRKSSVKPMPTEDEEVASTLKAFNSTYDKIDVDCNDRLNSTLERQSKARRLLRLINNSTAENINDTANVGITEQHNATSEKEIQSGKTCLNNASENGNISSTLNTTFEKHNLTQSKVICLDSTFNKSEPKLNTTFDKTESKLNSEKSSLISSDEGTINITFDKENDSRISITSDDSKADNIVNTTPVLIESSMDDSQLSASKVSQTFEPSKVEYIINISPPPRVSLQPPVTPLKREGTFTKESSDSKPNTTPNKRQTLPSPGCTPFHVTSTSQKEKSMLNVTRSIEKPSQRSSLAEIVSARQTRVMFCSPVNNPAVVMQQKKMVIKSSLKGSNKSFVFNDTAPAASERPSARKRSYTQSDVDDTRVKRKRFAHDMQHSVDRLSRPRTSNSTVKLPETTPSKKPPTPCKPKSEPKRTKLPNFAALHQRQFDKMESLDECQRRKMQRARKMLVPKTPNGTVRVLERTTPKKTVELIKPSESPAKTTETPPNLTKCPTLESLRPAVTKFGFRMHTQFNPFSVPSKTDKTTNPEKPKCLIPKPISAPKTVLPTEKAPARRPILPSVSGTTTTRKEAAKQTVMREKSFTSLSDRRNVKRIESRTIIKGVRTNRRFDLQMQMRNMD